MLQRRPTAADISLASVDLLGFARGLQSGIMTPEQVLLLLDIHASETSSRTWNPVSRHHRQEESIQR
ncbi:hypothetical protein T265_04311 [Opisthorchis viverrini]|uniref:Uncharacterized protein n=1 Tax=Opisthorchis viverrini TaxID=6198 RepID=A0A074ZNQ2_OPIVI|nr:hypothetical protein T265_04311 [Opisthorchis viverrini]KER29023.1 hypothetical protein T265_04311 [Opisthorchis viverrini]